MVTSTSYELLRRSFLFSIEFIQNRYVYYSLYYYSIVIGDGVLEKKIIVIVIHAFVASILIGFMEKNQTLYRIWGFNKLIIYNRTLNLRFWISVEGIYEREWDWFSVGSSRECSTQIKCKLLFNTCIIFEERLFIYSFIYLFKFIFTRSMRKVD